MTKPNPTENWEKFKGNKIPSSLELDPIIFHYLKNNFKIIDIGCGFGKTVFELYKKGYKNIYGIDVNKNGIEFAKTRARKSGFNLLPNLSVGNAISLNFPDYTFDFVICQAFWTTIITKSERNKIIKEIGRVLKKAGMLYIAAFGQTWNYPHYKQVYCKGIEKQYEIGTFEAFDKKTGEFKYLAHHYTKKELEELLDRGGLKKLDYYKQTTFTTQSGNQVKGHVLLAVKN